ncbi:MAG: DeoR/GlpR family DNA-binding transcription regulator [Actinomycetales bacterium]|nr:DeoR/GlpR family DNA-binding transcription regulator [Actinomycetales bacterium]
MPASNDSNQRRLPAGRKAALATYVAEMGQVTVADLAERFDVSADTIRRDLDQLDADGVLIRTHGGAISPQAVPRPDTAMDVRLRLQTLAKDQIGASAARLVQDGAAIMVNAGTTTLALAKHLSEHRDLTIATNSLRIPTEISPLAVRDLYVFGGAVRLSAQATVGPVAFAGTDGFERDIRCDLALIGVGAVSATAGFSTSNLGEATMMRAMIDRADRVAVLADATKFGRRLFAVIAGFDRVDYLVTDQEPPADLAAALRVGDVEVVLPGAQGPEQP